jgi:hypothetical protein
MTPLAARRIARLARGGSVAAVARALGREAWLRGERIRLERALRSEAPLVVGPFVGEVGFELLYWRPMVRRLLRRYRVDRDRVTVVGRGGSGLWYRDVAGAQRDVLEVVTPEELHEGIEVRVRRTGQRKQVDVDAFDSELITRLGLDDQALLHPFHVYWGFRFVWEGLEPPSAAEAQGDYDPLERDESLLDGISLPDRFVAIKVYENECLPATSENRAAVRETVSLLSRWMPVVALETGLVLDDHRELPSGALTPLASGLEPRRNLVQQAEVVARASALVATYGGFSYLGAFYDVPTVAISRTFEWNRLHENVLRAVRPAARYVRATPDEAAPAVEALL